MNTNTQLQLNTPTVSSGGPSPRLKLGLIALCLLSLLLPGTASARETRECHRHHGGGFFGHLGREFKKNILPKLHDNVVKPLERAARKDFIKPAEHTLERAARTRLKREVAPLEQDFRDMTNTAAGWIQ